MEKIISFPLNTFIEWSEIIIHHSATPDRAIGNDRNAIKLFHTSWRHEGNIITEEQAMELKGKKHKDVIPPWRDIGYHGVIELFMNKLSWNNGRSFNMNGAHCTGRNYKAIGVCIVGNFDITKPDEETYKFTAERCIEIMDRYKLITVENIMPHNKYANKSCPGKNFNMNKLKDYIIQIQKEGGENDGH